MLRSFGGVVTAAIILLAVSSGYAGAATYNYVGGNYTNQTSNNVGGCCNPYQAAFAAAIALKEPLQPNTTTSLLTWSTEYPYDSWTASISPVFVEARFSTGASDGVTRPTGVIHPYVPPIFSAWERVIISLTTDAGGAIVDWLIELSWVDSRYGSEFARSTAAGESVGSTWGVWTYTASASAGSWTIAAVPVPEPFWLLVAAVALLFSSQAKFAQFGGPASRARQSRFRPAPINPTP